MDVGRLPEILWLSGYGLLLGAAAITDIRSLRIPNLIPVLLIALFFVAALATRRPVAWGSHLAAAGIILAVGIGLFAWGKFGGGDVKLLTAVSLWQGLHLLPALLVAVAIVGGVLGLVCLLMRRSGFGVFLAARGIQAISLEDGAGIPYAVAIGVGCGLLVPHLPLLQG
jgi:prepilin peptidase CpaA